MVYKCPNIMFYLVTSFCFIYLSDSGWFWAAALAFNTSVRQTPVLFSPYLLVTLLLKLKYTHNSHGLFEYLTAAVNSLVILLTHYARPSTRDSVKGCNFLTCTVVLDTLSSLKTPTVGF